MDSKLDRNHLIGRYARDVNVCEKVCLCIHRETRWKEVQKMKTSTVMSSAKEENRYVHVVTVAHDVLL